MSFGNQGNQSSEMFDRVGDIFHHTTGLEAVRKQYCEVMMNGRFNEIFRFEEFKAS